MANEMTLQAVMVISLGGVWSAITATRPVKGITVARGIVEMTLQAVLVISLRGAGAQSPLHALWTGFLVSRGLLK